MEAMAQLGILAAASLVAAAAAFGTAWAFLRGAFRLIEPAAAGGGAAIANPGYPRRPRLELVEGTRAAARAFGRS